MILYSSYLNLKGIWSQVKLEFQVKYLKATRFSKKLLSMPRWRKHVRNILAADDFCVPPTCLEQP